jgi:molybdopterin molybdotransferase
VRQALGMVVARDVMAPGDVPGFDRAAFDGYAVRLGTERGAVLRMSGEVFPGVPAGDGPGEGEVWVISTGAEVPAGCGVVVAEEMEVRDGGEVVCGVAVDEGNVRRRGGVFGAGEMLLPAGTRVSAGDVAVLCSAGVSRLEVVRKPGVFHITTGSEVVPVEHAAGVGLVHDVNGPMLGALLYRMDVPVRGYGHALDDVEALRAALEQGGENDLILVSGGSSGGGRDTTRAALEAEGFDVLVHGIALKPGRPMMLGRRGEQWVMGIPGSPLSHYVVFHLFVRRALELLSGKRPWAPFYAVFSGGRMRGDARRETFHPAFASMDGGRISVEVAEWVDASDVSSLRAVNCLVRLGAGAEAPKVCDLVEVVPCGDIP